MAAKVESSTGRRESGAQMYVRQAKTAAQLREENQSHHHHLHRVQQWLHDKKHRFLMWLEGKEEMSDHERGLVEMAMLIRTYRGIAEEDDKDANKPWIDRPISEIVSTIFILINAILLGLEVDLGEEDGFERHVAWIALEAFFCMVFCLEIAFKTRAHTWKWIFYELWNFYSALAAFLMVLDFLLMAGGVKAYLRTLSLLRVAGVLRLNRIIKRYRLLKELRLLIQGITSSLSELFWTTLLLILFIYMCGCFMTEQIGRNTDVYSPYTKVSGGWDHLEYFGTVGRSMQTLLQIATLDRWCSFIVRHVVNNQWYLGIFFFLFVFFISFGLLNIMVSVVTEHMLEAAASNAKQAKLREEKNRISELEVMEDIFHHAESVDHHGYIDLNSFLAAASNPKVQQELRQLQLPVGECAKLFAVVGGDGFRSLSMAEFIKGCSQLTGSAQSKDLLAVQAQADILAGKMDELGESLSESERMMEVLDMITLRTLHRFEPAVLGTKRKIAQSVGGREPMVRPKMYRGDAGGDEEPGIQVGNCPRLPDFPNLLR